MGIASGSLGPLRKALLEAFMAGDMAAYEAANKALRDWLVHNPPHKVTR